MKTIYSIIGLSLFSIANAIYLTIAAFKSKAQISQNLFCDLSENVSCSNLFAFDFSWIFGIPFPLIALFVYPIIIFLALYYVFKKNTNILKIIIGLSIGGILFNSYIIYNEFVVGVFCLACLMCSLSIASIGVLSFLKMKNLTK